MTCVADERFSEDYLDPKKRSISNAIRIFFKDGSSTEEVVVEYPAWHRRRRAEGVPLLVDKFQRNLKRRYRKQRRDRIFDLALDHERLIETPVTEFTDLLAI